MTQMKPNQFSVPALLHSISVRESTAAWIWHHDLNGDMVDDVIVNLLEPENSVRFFLGRADTAFLESQSRIREVTVKSKNDLMIVDANNDGIEDIVLNNKLKKSIQFYAGRGDGTFLPKTRLVSTEGIGGFTIGDIDNDNISELLYTDQVNGIVKVIHFNGEGK